MTAEERLKNRPVYAGLPVPYAVVVDSQGVPDFKVTDMARWAICIRDKLCAICGGPLEYWVWYIGGQSCADQGVYLDLAMHEECAFYSARICPFLAKGRDYAEDPQVPTGYQIMLRHEVAKSTVLYASKRRRDQVEIIHNGDALAVKTGPEVKRVQIFPKT